MSMADAVYNLESDRFRYDGEKDIVQISSDNPSEVPRFRDSVLQTLELILNDHNITEVYNDERELYDNMNTSAGNPLLKVRVYSLTNGIAFAVISVDPEFNADFIEVNVTKEKFLEYLFQ